MNEEMTSTQTTSVPEQPKILFLEKVGYGAGDLASNLLYAAIGSFLIFFYTDSIGISAGIIGTIMLFSRVFDGVTDIGMGLLVDKTSTKHGKARPWILWMAIPFALTAISMFTVPDVSTVWKIVYIVITYNLFSLIYTAINIPYGVLNSLITQDAYDRSVLNIFRNFSATIGSMIIGVLTMPIVNAFGGEQSSWIMTFTIFSIAAALLFYFTFRTTKERVGAAVSGSKSTNVPLGKGLKALFSNKYWLIMVSLSIIGFMNLSISAGIGIYYAKYILGNEELIGVLTVAQILPTLIGLFLIAPIIKRFGKRNTMMIGLFVTMIGVIPILFNPENVWLVVVAIAIRGIGTAPVGGTIFAMIADTIEYGEWKYGVRTEGLVYSAGSFGTKVGSGLGAAILGWMMSFGGYIGSDAIQSEAAFFTIKFIAIAVPLILSIVQVILLSFHKLDKIYPKILADLEARCG